ncbi:MAG: hypothetical protein QUS33_02505 [Dehalococcoidia bacterium]|nr:hypothetical protein [Dehalococcoidia bacterium]
MDIKVVDVSAKDSTVTYRLAYPSGVKKYLLSDTFFVKYDGQIEVARIDRSILAIPLVSMLAPVCWALGADLELDALDEAYLHCLDKVRRVLTTWYPRFSNLGTINVKTPVKNQLGGTRACLLFSGGLDAFTSYTRHRDEKPDLVSIWCHDPRLHEEEKWNCVLAAARWLCERDGVTSLQVKSDLTDINDRLLNHVFGVSWYAQVAHGLLQLSLCAPITAVRNAGKVYIASSCRQDRLYPLGSHPAIDNNVTWAGVVVTHDGGEMSRQQKMRYMRTADRDCLTKLKVCHIYPQNCAKCEKCFRTITGLCMEGLNPRDCGFNVDDKTLKRIRQSIIMGKMPMPGSEKVEWEELQRCVPVETGADIIGSREFLTWFRAYDFSQHRIDKGRRRQWVYWLEWLRFVHSAKPGRVTGELLKYVRYWIVCRLHLIVYHGRSVLARKLRFIRPPA